MKKTVYFFIYFITFMLAFIFPILISHYSFNKNHSNNTTKKDKIPALPSLNNNVKPLIMSDMNTSDFEGEEEAMPLTLKANIPLLNKAMSTKAIEDECFKIYQEYNNRTRLEWDEMFTTDIRTYHTSIIALVDPAVWLNISLKNQKIITQDLFFCLRISQKNSLQKIKVLDADTHSLLMHYSLNNGLIIQRKKSDFNSEDFLE